MASLNRGSFSLRGSKAPPWYIVAAITLAAFAIGIGVGWLTGVIPTAVRALQPDVGPSATPTIPVVVPTAPVVSADQYPPIFRAMDAEDAVAGLNSLDIPLEAGRTMVPVPGVDEPAVAGLTRLVRIEIEDGLPLAGTVVSDAMMSILNDPRGWGAGSQTFARTEGVPEIRILVASPQTAAALCARPHDPFTVALGPVDEVTLPDLAATSDPAPDVKLDAKPKKGGKGATTAPAATSSPAPSSTTAVDLVPSCADRGFVVINAYYWAAGVASFGEDRASARAWLLNHFVGHYRAQPDVACDTTLKNPAASVMVDHAFDISPCTPQAWPFPDGVAADPAADA